jgi:leucyl/phenylalanyl-tRNA---protein transferase
MPAEPLPTTWAIARPPDDHPSDAWALGADLEPGTLLAAYRTGIFPMRAQRNRVGARLKPGTHSELLWWSPDPRGIVPLEQFRPSRSLRRAARGFEIRVDGAFAEVIRGCADPRRPHGWIEPDFIAAYTRLHEAGWAHSVEAWDEDGLAGGLYGVASGGLFAAESMYHVRTGASKAAFLGLVELLRAAGGPRLLDVQWATPLLVSLGAAEVTRAAYHRRLDVALALPDPFETDAPG